VKRRQRTHAASGGASEALPHEVGARPSRSEPKLNTHALYPSRSELRGITFKNKKSASEIMKFLEDFPGIGPKYARNIMMDSYHPLFRDRIALDSRVRSVSKKLGIDFKDYSDYENFYLRVAKEAGIEGWELDRLIWEHIDDFLKPL